MKVLLHGCRAVVRRRDFTAALMLLFALLVAAPLAAKPIPLTQPLDLQGKRVLVVPLLGRTAGAYSFSRMIFGSYSRDQGEPGSGINVDAVAAREVQGKLAGLGVDAEVLAIDYDDVDIYGDRESLFNRQMPKGWKLDAIAAQLLRDKQPDAVLLLARSGMYMGDYLPPAIGYGVVLTRKGGGAYVSMLQALYVPGRKSPQTTRIANARRPVDDIVSEENLEFPPPETWAKVAPLLDDLTGRLGRSLAAEIYDRARRPPPTATSTWRSIYTREEFVDPFSP